MIPSIDIFYRFNGKEYISVEQYDKEIKELEQEIERLKKELEEEKEERWKERYREYRHYLNVESNKQCKRDLVSERDTYKERLQDIENYIRSFPIETLEESLLCKFNDILLIKNGTITCHKEEEK